MDKFLLRVLQIAIITVLVVTGASIGVIFGGLAFATIRYITLG